MHDYQRTNVYKWEDQFDEGKLIPFDQLQAYVNRVWSEMGLLYPPTVTVKPKNATKIRADATRMEIRFNHKGENERIVLHEMAHSMLAHIDGLSHQHNDVFVGMYMTLMEKFMGMPIFLLWASANAVGVDYQKFVKPRITDGNEING